MEKVLRQPREQVFAAAKQIGFEGLEIEVRGDLEALRAAQSEAGLRVCSIICDGVGLGAMKLEERIVARQRLRRAVADAAALRAGSIRLPQFDLADPGDAPATKRFVDDLGYCLPEAEARQIVLCWENALDARSTREVIDQVDSDYFRCCFDLANAAERGDDPAAEIRALGDRIGQVHAKNTDRQPLDAPGVDLHACLAALKNVGYNGWIVLETAAGYDPLESARHNLAVVREGLGAV
jgi:sugar phosphate isomerase/epimerase